MKINVFVFSCLCLLFTTNVFAHGDAQPQPIDTSTLPQLGKKKGVSIENMVDFVRDATNGKIKGEDNFSPQSWTRLLGKLTDGSAENWCEVHVEGFVR